ncbi:MAG: hypothetical protein EBR82_16240 [Caulobacteraceae bacterium]|nr:hypothetical protein [Caulobacteraceae bacterium]
MLSRGVVSNLQSMLELLPIDLLERVNREGGLQIADLLDLISAPKDYTVYDPTPICDVDVVNSDMAALGDESLRTGETAVCIFAPEESLQRIPGPELSLLSLKLLQCSTATCVWVVTTPSVYDEVQSHLKGLIGVSPRVVPQYETFLLEVNSRLKLNDNAPSMVSCGTGDVIPALTHSGLLDSFGGRHIAIVNAMNALGAPVSAMVGEHITGKKPVTWEVAPREMADETPVLCEHDGIVQLVEVNRLSGVHKNAFKFTDTGCCVIRSDLQWSSVQWRWDRVRRNRDHSFSVAYQRSITDLCATFQTRFLASPRDSRYLMVDGQLGPRDVPRIFQAI